MIKPVLKNTTPIETDNFFQAIGTICGVVEKIKDTGGYSILFDNKSYNLHVPAHKYTIWKKFCKEQDDNLIWLRVYPKVLLRKDEIPDIRFEVIAWKDYDEWGEGSNRFKVHGIWQFIAQNKTPVLTVYRNSNDLSKPNTFVKPVHIPIIMRRTEIDPYSYAKVKIAKTIVEKWFMSVYCKLLTKTNTFKFICDSSQPTKTIPKYVKSGRSEQGELDR